MPKLLFTSDHIAIALAIDHNHKVLLQHWLWDLKEAYGVDGIGAEIYGTTQLYHKDWVKRVERGQVSEHYLTGYNLSVVPAITVEGLKMLAEHSSGDKEILRLGGREYKLDWEQLLRERHPELEQGALLMNVVKLDRKGPNPSLSAQR